MAEARLCELNERSAGIHRDEEKGENRGRKQRQGERQGLRRLGHPPGTQSRSAGRKEVQSSPGLAKGTDLHMEEPNRMDTNATSPIIEVLDTKPRKHSLTEGHITTLPSSTWQGIPPPKPWWTSLREEKEDTKVDRGAPGQTRGARILQPTEMSFRNEEHQENISHQQSHPERKPQGHSPSRREGDLGSAEKPTMNGESSSEHASHDC